MKDDFSGVILVDASAGSGKTSELAGRYFELILAGEGRERGSFREILAITFTNKAAFGMKARILSLLKEAALAPHSSPAEAASARAAAQVIEDILKDFGSFRVQTTDSFMNSILESNFPEIDLPSGFLIKKDYRSYIDYCLDELMSAAASDRSVRKLFENFIESYLYSGPAGGWFPRTHITRVVNDLFSHSNVHGTPFRKTHRGSPGAKRKKLLRAALSLKENLPDSANSHLVKLLEEITGLETLDADRLAGSKTITGSDGFPVKKGGAAPRKTREGWKRFRKALTEYCEAECFTGFNHYIDIFKGLSGRFREITGEDRTIFLEELNSRAHPVLAGESFSASGLFLKLATTLRHYLVDEFQDTSSLQMRNFAGLFREGLATGGSVFLVGDRKQAIFRFRGSDYYVAEKIREQYGMFGLREKKLSHNYRSREEVVRFNNLVFSPANLGRFIDASGGEFTGGAEKKEILEIFSNSEQTWSGKNAGGFVKTEFIVSRDREEAETAIRGKLTDLAGELRGRFPLSGIAVLVRDNERLCEVSGWLMEAGIPVESERTLNIRENGAVKEIISLLGFLDSPIDNIAFAGFIQGGIFGEASGMGSAALGEFMLSWRRKKERPYLYEEFREKHPGHWKRFFEKLFKQAGLLPVYEQTLEIIKTFGVLPRPARDGYITKLLETMHNRESEEGELGAGSFLEYFRMMPEEELYVSSPAGESVKLTTIHKAKGLEFNAVIIPFFSVNPRPGIGKNSLLVKADADSIRLLKLKKARVNASAKLRELYAEEYKKALIDELNVSYVALTRARDELYVFVPVPEEDCASLIPGGAERGERAPAFSAEPSPPADGLAPRGIKDYPGGVKMLGEEFPEALRAGSRKKLETGEAVHRLLSELGDLSNAGAEAVGNAVRNARARTAGGLPENIEKKITGIVERRDCRKFFYTGGAEVLTEKEIADEEGRRMRIDRLVVKEKQVWVVDFKSSECTPDDLLQVKRYLKSVKAIYPDREVSGFIVFTGRPGLRKIDE